MLFHGAEIAVDTALQIFRLAYIYNFTVFIFHNIDAGLFREHERLFAEFFHNATCVREYA